MGNSLSRPEVAQGLADFVAEQILDLAQLESLSSETVPDRLEPLLPVAREAAERQVSERIERLITSDQGRAVIVEAARQSHKAALAIIEDRPPPPGVTVNDDSVSLNLLPLLLQGLTAAAETALVPQVALPELTADGSITGQIRQLEFAYEVNLPHDFGQLLLYQGDQIAEGHRILDLTRRSATYFNRATVVLVLLTLVSAAATIGFARRRARTVGLLATGAALVLLLQRVLVDQAVGQTANLPIDPTARSLVSALAITLTSSLLTALTVIVCVAVAVAVIAISLAMAIGVRGSKRRRTAF